MKNAIYYYYNLECEELIKRNEKYIILSNNSYYALLPCIFNNENINELYKLNNHLLWYGIRTYQFVTNNTNNIITNINNINYVLIKIYNNYKERINLNDIMQFCSIFPVKKGQNIRWKELWMNKIDYFEYQISQFGLKYPIVRKTIDYYIGMTETAISLLNNIKPVDLYIAHYRINSELNNIVLYNPLNYIIDTRTRDIAEYFKTLFFMKNNSINVEKYIFDFLNTINFSDDELFLFFIRLLYPSYYFDLYEKIVREEIEEENINYILNKNVEYEKLIKKIYMFLNKKISMPSIEWLKY